MAYAMGYGLAPLRGLWREGRGFLPKHKLAVIGAGQFGKNHCRVIHESERAQLVAVVDTDAARAGEMAAQYGAEAFTDFRQALGLVDAAVVAVPSQAAVLQALELVRGSGKILLFAHTHRGPHSRLALPPPEAPHPSQPSHNSHPSSSPHLDLSTICVDEKDLIGSYSSDFTLQAEVARLIFSRKLDVRKLVTHHFPLEQTAAAIALAGSPAADSLKVVVNQELMNE